MKKLNDNIINSIESENYTEYSDWSKSPLMRMKHEKNLLPTINMKIKLLRLNYISKIGIRNKIHFKVSGSHSTAWEFFSGIG